MCFLFSEPAKIHIFWNKRKFWTLKELIIRKNAQWPFNKESRIPLTIEQITDMYSTSFEIDDSFLKSNP
jgi:hypothetical protein